MRNKTNLTLTIFAMLILSSLGTAQSVRRRATKETEKTVPPTVSIREEAVVTKRLERDSPELQKVYDDKRFLDACAVLATSGEMFLVDSAQITRDGEKFAVTFNVVNEVRKEPGQYKQLVYAFDGKDSYVYFNEQNSNYTKVKPTSSSTSKMKWPPAWWPGSGGGTIGLGGGFEWDEWHEVSVECHFTFICPFIEFNHRGKMRQEERASKSHPWIKQTRWILIRCYCY